MFVSFHFQILNVKNLRVTDLFFNDELGKNNTKYHTDIPLIFSRGKYYL